MFISRFYCEHILAIQIHRKGKPLFACFPEDKMFKKTFLVTDVLEVKVVLNAAAVRALIG